MTILKLIRPKKARHRKSTKKLCRCGCGKPAIWPRDDRPIFNTRLCGYVMAVCAFGGRKVGR